LAALGKEPSRGFPIHLTNLHALLNDQKAGSRNGSTSHQLAFGLPSTVTPPLRTDWGTSLFKVNEARTESAGTKHVIDVNPAYETLVGRGQWEFSARKIWILTGEDPRQRHDHDLINLRDARPMNPNSAVSPEKRGTLRD